MAKLENDFLEKCTYKDYPANGVSFIDIFPILREFYPQDFEQKFSGRFEDSIVFVPEARGFLFYGHINPKLSVPLRKPNKLPGELYTFSYQKEYGEDALCFSLHHLKQAINCYLQTHKCEDNIIPITFFDDILATGGTTKAFISYIENIKVEGYSFKVKDCKFYIILNDLCGKDILSSLNIPITSVYEI